MEFLFEFLAEFLLQFVFEGLANLGFHAFSGAFSKERSPAFSAIMCLLAGLAAGGLSLLAFPGSFITTPALKIANLVMTPIAVGALMDQVGRWRESRDGRLIRLERFGYAFLFALGMALARYLWAT